jgi:hypothetical protein
MLLNKLLLDPGFKCIEGEINIGGAEQLQGKIDPTVFL